MLVEVYQFRVRAHDPLLTSLRAATVNSRRKRVERKQQERTENCGPLQQNGASRHGERLLDHSSMGKNVGERSNDSRFSEFFSLAILDDLIVIPPHVAVALLRKSAKGNYIGPRGR